MTPLQQRRAWLVQQCFLHIVRGLGPLLLQHQLKRDIGAGVGVAASRPAKAQLSLAEVPLTELDHRQVGASASVAGTFGERDSQLVGCGIVLLAQIQAAAIIAEKFYIAGCKLCGCSVIPIDEMVLPQQLVDYRQAMMCCSIVRPVTDQLQVGGCRRFQVSVPPKLVPENLAGPRQQLSLHQTARRSGKTAGGRSKQCSHRHGQAHWQLWRATQSATCGSDYHSHRSAADGVASLAVQHEIEEQSKRSEYDRSSQHEGNEGYGAMTGMGAFTRPNHRPQATPTEGG